MQKIAVLIDADEFARLNRVDARMNALISCIEEYEDRVERARNKVRPIPPIELNTVKAIIGMCDE